MRVSKDAGNYFEILSPSRPTFHFTENNVRITTATWCSY